MLTPQASAPEPDMLENQSEEWLIGKLTGLTSEYRSDMPISADREANLRRKPEAFNAVRFRGTLSQWKPFELARCFCQSTSATGTARLHTAGTKASF